MRLGRTSALFAEQSTSSTKRLDVTFLLCVCPEEQHCDGDGVDLKRTGCRRAYNARAERKYGRGGGRDERPARGSLTYVRSSRCAARHESGFQYRLSCCRGVIGGLLSRR